MINVVDLFAGPGGLALGFELATNSRGKGAFKTIKLAEREFWACETLRKNFKKNIVLEGDLREESVKNDIEKTCKKKTDIVVGGPPCQSFSTLGPRSGNKAKKVNMYKYDNLYHEFVEIVERLSPKFILFENVKGILSKHNGNQKVIDMIISDLSKLGYNFRSQNNEIKKNYILLNASDFGVPQNRERIFIIGNNLGIDNPYPVKTHSIIKRGKYPKNISSCVTIHDAIGDLPSVKPMKTMSHVPEHRTMEIARYNKRVNPGKDDVEYRKEWSEIHMKKIDKKGKDFFSFVRPACDIPLTHHTARSQMETDIKLFKGMERGTTARDVIESNNPKINALSKYIRYDMKSFTDKYKKQSWDRPSSTIFAHLQKDGNRFIHPSSHQARTFTPREAARIQSFPDSFYFEGGLGRKFQQIGNAVPPLLAKSLAESIYGSISG